MHLRSDSFKPYDRLDPKYAFGKHDPETHFTFAGNTNPHLAWSGAPEGTKSFVLICVDLDVPSVGDDVNQEGKTVDIDLPRAPFYHWVLIDLKPSITEIAEGSHSSEVTPKGKMGGPTPDGGLQCRNNYTEWFAGNEDMGGIYTGYDGPAPPWNDERLHGYRFRVYALDKKNLGLSPGNTGADVEEVMKGHVLAQAEIIGLYAINPSV